ncbi:MAG: hypothetical protein AB7P04_05295 [Bacteriovoracia bacterium]
MKQLNTVLVVSEDLELSRRLATCLLGLGFMVVTASGPGAAETVVGACTVDAIISDVHLRGNLGRSLVRALHRRHSGDPAYFFTNDYAGECLSCVVISGHYDSLVPSLKRLA